MAEGLRSERSRATADGCYRKKTLSCGAKGQGFGFPNENEKNRLAQLTFQKVSKLKIPEDA